MLILITVFICTITASAKSSTKVKVKLKENKVVLEPYCNYFEYQYDCFGSIVGYVSIAYGCNSGTVNWNLSNIHIDEIALFSNCA